MAREYRYWTDGELQQAVVWRDAGLGLKEVSRRLGRSYSSVRAALHDHGLQRRFDVRARVRQLHAASLSPTAIAALVHRSRAHVMELIREMGLPKSAGEKREQ